MTFVSPPRAHLRDLADGHYAEVHAVKHPQCVSSHNGRACCRTSQPTEWWRNEGDLQVSFSDCFNRPSPSVCPQMDPVQKAVLHHTLGLPPAVKRRHVSCSVCRLRFNSQVSTVLLLKRRASSKANSEIIRKRPFLEQSLGVLFRSSALSWIAAVQPRAFTFQHLSNVLEKPLSLIHIYIYILEAGQLTCSI